MDANRDAVALSRERFIDLVVDHLEDEVVEPALARVPDVHAGALPDGLETLEDLDVFRAVDSGSLRGAHEPPKRGFARSVYSTLDRLQVPPPMRSNSPNISGSWIALAGSGRTLSDVRWNALETEPS